ncbi:hypothetical protein U1Q18_021214 [Sarracenia purpurea var. burkii]
MEPCSAHSSDGGCRRRKLHVEHLEGERIDRDRYRNRPGNKFDLQKSRFDQIQATDRNFILTIKSIGVSCNCRENQNRPNLATLELLQDPEISPAAAVFRPEKRGGRTEVFESLKMEALGLRGDAPVVGEACVGGAVVSVMDGMVEES